MPARSAVSPFSFSRHQKVLLVHSVALACTHPGFLSDAAAGSVPLNQHFPEVQQENITLIETVPGKRYLSQRNGSARQTREDNKNHRSQATAIANLPLGV